MVSGTVRSRPIVLVVEDEPLLRMHAVDLMEDAGFLAIEARDADEAIEILETRTDIRIVFTDIDMPGSINGLLLAAAVRNRWPPIDIIVTSGNAVPKHGEVPERGFFFPKPYSDAKLVEAVRSLAGL